MSSAQWLPFCLGLRGLSARAYSGDHLTKLKFRQISFALNIFLSFQIVLKFCAEHDSTTAVLCAKW